jgi:hypothetical protein
MTTSVNEKIKKFNVSFNDMLKEVVTEKGVISECYTMFHNFSITNQILAFYQLKSMGLPVRPIACKSAWGKKGREIKPEQEGNPIWLRMPMTKKFVDTNENGEEVENFRTFYNFRPNWYSLSQTQGKNGKKAPILRPSVDVSGFDIERVIKANDIKKIEYDSVDGNCQGFCYPEKREYAISPLAENVLKTTIHEIAHIMLKHNSENMSRGLQELEAETTAYIVLSVIDGASETDLEKMRGYIQSWFKGNVVPEKNAKRIMSVADKIIKTGLGLGKE